MADSRQAALGQAAARLGQRGHDEAHHGRWFEQLFGETSDGVFVVGPDFRVLWWGPRAEELLGIPSSVAVGRRCFELIAGRHGTGQAECGPGCWVMRAARRGRSVPAFRVQVRSAGAERRSYTLGLMRDQAGTFLVHLLRPQELAEPPVVGCSPTTGEPSGVGDVDFQPPNEAAAADPVSWLTAREREVLRLILGGATSQEIAARLSISHATARNHVQNVLMKLGVHSRVEAAIVAFQAGLEPPAESPQA